MLNCSCGACGDGTFLGPWITRLCASILKMKNALRETQTLRAGCSKAEPKKFAPPQTPFQNLISWRWSLPLPTNPVWWGLMHAISNTHPYTHKKTRRQDRLQYTAPLSLARSVIIGLRAHILARHVLTFLHTIRYFPNDLQRRLPRIF